MQADAVAEAIDSAGKARGEAKDAAACMAKAEPRLWHAEEQVTKIDASLAELRAAAAAAAVAAAAAATNAAVQQETEQQQQQQPTEAPTTSPTASELAALAEQVQAGVASQVQAAMAEQVAVEVATQLSGGSSGRSATHLSGGSGGGSASDTGDGGRGGGVVGELRQALDMQASSLAALEQRVTKRSADDDAAMHQLEQHVSGGLFRTRGCMVGVWARAEWRVLAWKALV